MSSFQFNAVLLDISNNLSEKQLEDIKFMCNDVIGKRDMENIDTGIKLFQFLTERGKLAVDNRERLCKLLEAVNRPDLAEKLRDFEPESEPGGVYSQPDDGERAKLDIAEEVIVGSLGKNWRKLGRKLGLNDVKLDSIENKHPTDLEERAVELLRVWRRIQGAEARIEMLIQALRACDLNMTADNVVDKLKM